MEKETLNALNAPAESERLAALAAICASEHIFGESKPHYVNNHIHTTYSFSPYSPTSAVYAAARAGLVTAGIMDHDSIGGAAEFVAAGRIAGMSVTVGVETRVNFSDTPFASRRINNPDQTGVAYMALHGIPASGFKRADAFFASVRDKRNIRNRAMCGKLAAVLRPLQVDFDFADVLPYSVIESGGSVTERTVCFAAANKLIEAYPDPAALLQVLTGSLSIEVSKSNRERLLSLDPVHYAYDVTGILKGGLVERFYIDATDELPSLTEFVALGNELGAIIAYAYLGDVEQSVTGDKKAQTFEDEYLDGLLPYLKAAGVHAVAYMPSRNTAAQISRLHSLCERLGLFEISGEDINSSRQSFVIPALSKSENAHLIEATWALIGHEAAVNRDKAQGMFAPAAVQRFPDLKARIAHFAAEGRKP